MWMSFETISLPGKDLMILGWSIALWLALTRAEKGLAT
jgi:hypothetical protein